MHFKSNIINFENRKTCPTKMNLRKDCKTHFMHVSRKCFSHFKPIYIREIKSSPKLENMDIDPHLNNIIGLCPDETDLINDILNFFLPD